MGGRSLVGVPMARYFCGNGDGTLAILTSMPLPQRGYMFIEELHV
jgi:hypothetical protein